MNSTQKSTTLISRLFPYFAKVMLGNDNHRNLKLLNSVEETFGECPTTPKSFICLSMDIANKTGTRVSVSTLKRVWGYISYNNKTSIHILNTLAIYAGYNDYLDFCNSIQTDQIILSGTTITIGDIIEVTYKEKSPLHLKYLGKSKFIIAR